MGILNFFFHFRLTVSYQKGGIVNGNYPFALKTMTCSCIQLSSGQHEKPQKLTAPFQLLPSHISLLKVIPSISDIYPFLCFNANYLRILKLMKPLYDISSQTLAIHSNLSIIHSNLFWLCTHNLDTLCYRNRRRM